MALEKQQISIDLVSGAETKINSQISDKPQDMVNVVFSGDMTAKKMNGYDRIAELDSGEYYSALFTKGNDLLIQSEKGSYKYFENLSTFKKISNIGSASIEAATSYGEYFCAGTSFNMHVGFTYGTLDVAGILGSRFFITQTFTDKAGAVLNTIQSEILAASLTLNQAEAMRWVQTFEYNNEFFVFKPNNTTKCCLEKFTYNALANQFVSSALANFASTTYTAISSSDLITDGSNVYWSVINASNAYVYKFSNSALAYIGNYSFPVSEVYSSFKLTIKDASNLYVNYCKYDGAVVVELKQIVLSKALVLGTSTVITTFNDSASPHFCSYPLTDTTAKWVYYPISPLVFIPGGLLATFDYAPFLYCNAYFGGVPGGSKYFSGVHPVGEIFFENGNYYQLVNSGIGVDHVYSVVNIDDGSTVAVMDATKISQKAGGMQSYNLPNDVTFKYMYSIKKMYKESGSWFLPTKSKTDSSVYTYVYAGEILPITPIVKLFSLNLNASTRNTQLEMSGKSNIFNARPAYFDGSELAELGFSNKPFLYLANAYPIGGVITNGTYQFVAVYKYKDASGDFFYSDISNILGYNSPLILSSGSVTTWSFNLTVYVPLLTNKKVVQVIIYMKKDSDEFSKCQSFFTDNAQNASQVGVYTIPIIQYIPLSSQSLSIPDRGLYATATFAAGGDYPTAPLTNTVTAAIYEDRVYSITRDSLNSIIFSQTRLPSWGLEFNQDIFYASVYDKRGVYEDKITGVISMDGRLLIFKERSILYIAGAGPSRANTSNDLSSPQLITTDVGCISTKSIVLGPEGVMFLSDKGIYLLNRKLQVTYIGAAVERYNSNTITSAILLEKVNEIRFTTIDGELLVYNYYSQAWSWFTNMSAVAACVWKGSYMVLLTSGKVYKESLVHKKIVNGLISTAIVQKISTPWVRIQAKQAWAKVYETMILGRYKTPHQVKVSFYYDYELYPSNVYILDPLASTDYNVVVRPSDASIESGAKYDGVYQLLIDMVRKNCEAFRLEIEDIPLDVANNTGESFALSNIEVTVGLKKNPAKLNPEKTY